MTFLKQLWLTLRTNRFFVAVSTIVGTALYAQLQSWVTTGVFNESLGYWKKTVAGAVLVAAASVYHLNLPAPGTNPNPKP